MKDYQKRVFEEKQQLLDRLVKLTDYMRTDNFSALPAIEQELLMQQKMAMKNYHEVLEQRIERFRL